MPIQILPPQLANQIAAGEVVERPASVVKELVENSLDAGASDIRIDIENGGATLIRIRDNGQGIPKTELALALARHATSKISCLEDLEQILSLGFRGEALASISSVSRLTLTSRTAEQKEAWQVYAQGRDQETTIQPASHPVGTTVEVANLFFNTPARRKFLRTDKTEFAHIDEVIRRIALVKNNISFTLTHNGKILRQYRSAQTSEQKLKRVASICGEDFVRNALQIDWKHGDLHLSGFVATPQFARSQNDLSYSYINGRMVRDKVITHATRQAYSEFLSTEQFPAFVLFMDLNPEEIDVNVHPTKHEVRFHQARLIHDFIYQGIINALNEQDSLFSNVEKTQKNDTALSSQKIEHSVENDIHEPSMSWNIPQKPNRAAAGKNRFSSFSSSYGHSDKKIQTGQFFHHQPKTAPTKVERKAYEALLQQPEKIGEKLWQSDSENPIQSSLTTSVKTEATSSQTRRVLTLVQKRALLLQQNEDFYLLPLAKAQKLALRLALQHEEKKQPLLIPVVFRLNTQEWQQWQKNKIFFAQLGFELIENPNHKRITLNSVPTCLRHQNLQALVMRVLTLECHETVDFITVLCEQVELKEISVLADALNLLAEIESFSNQQSEKLLSELFISVDFSNYL